MLTSKDICKETGLNKTQVSRLVDYGAIEPAEPADGRGKVRRFNDVNLAEFFIAREFYALSLDVQVIAPGLHHLRTKIFYSKPDGPSYTFWEYVQSPEYRKIRRKHGEEPLWLLAADNYKTWIIISHTQLIEKLTIARKRPGFLSINLATIVTEVFYPPAVAPKAKARPKRVKDKKLDKQKVSN